MKTVAFAMYDDAEVLDFSGPFDVFSMSRIAWDEGLFELVTVSQDGKPITAIHGFTVVPSHGTADLAPGDVDILLVPGGSTRALDRLEAGAYDPLVDWIARVAAETEATGTVCLGAFFGAKAGLFCGRPATTHHGFLDRFAALTEPDGTTVLRGPRYVDAGVSAPAILSSAGVSAGLDLAFHMLERFASDDRAEGRTIRDKTAALMEYNATTNWTLAQA